jgi:hypothetical protein
MTQLEAEMKSAAAELRFEEAAAPDETSSPPPARLRPELTVPVTS